MGITGLIQFVEVATEQSTVHKLKGKTVAIDSYWLLHKGSYSCADKLVRGIKTTAMTDYALKYVKMLQSYCANIIMVFDGRSLPAKKETEAKRRENRQKAKLKADELVKSGRNDEARKEFSKAVVITHEHALDLIEECRRINVDCIVAMYEADGQLAYLNKIGLAEYVISEDSDLILFGCKKIVYKLTLDGKCTIFDSDKLHLTFPKYTFEKFRRICILSGCDYVNNLPGIGLSKAKKFMLMTAESDMKKAIPKIPSYLNLKITIPNNYIDDFLKGEATFLYMYVYDPIKREMVRLNELVNKEDEKYCVNAGELLKPDIAYQLALGNINPKNMQKLSDYDPSKPIPRSLKRPPTHCKYKPLFNLWEYNGKQETAVKVKQQSKITFIPVKFRRPEIQKIADEENNVEDGIEMDNLIAAYCESDAPTTSNHCKKRPSSVLNDDFNTSLSSPKNPFAKRLSLDTNGENANNLSLIKNLSSKETTANGCSFADSRVVSRFFSKKVESDDPLEILERMQNAKFLREIELEEQLESNRQYYSMVKNISKRNCTDDCDKSQLDKIKEKFENKTSKTIDCKPSSDDELESDSKYGNLPINDISSDDDDKSNDKTASHKSTINNKLKPQSQANNGKKSNIKTTSISLASQHRLSRFGFTKINKNIL